MSITLRECRGDEADQLDIELDDTDGKLKIPPKVAKLSFALGWLGAPLVDKGAFVVSKVEHSGAPDRLIIRARSASMIDAWQRIERGLAAFDMQLALGDASIMPQSPVVVSGFKADIDATEWLSKTVTHSISGSGFTTRIEFEPKSEQVDTEREPDHDPEEGITGVKAEWYDKGKKEEQQGHRAGRQGRQRQDPEADLCHEAKRHSCRCPGMGEDKGGARDHHREQCRLA